MVLKLVGNNRDMIEHLQIRENLNFQMPVKKLYYSAGYEPCCCHCTTKRNLANNSDYYPICTFCKRMGKKPIQKTRATKKKGQ